jgi:hypothetical protein
MKTVADPKTKSTDDAEQPSVNENAVHKPEYEDTRDNLDEDESFEEEDYFEK